MDCFEDLKNLYDEMVEERGAEAYKYIHELLEKAQELRYAYLAVHAPGKDKGQSWRSFIGNNFEKLLQHIITEAIKSHEVQVIGGRKLKGKRLSQELDAVKQNLTVNYGRFGELLPDADIVIYKPEKSRVIAVISSKTSLRERVVQTSYWKSKFQDSEHTKHIKVYLITPDRDKDLTKVDPAKKPRIIAEIDLDGTYVLTTEALEESDNVKLFEHFIHDLKQVIEESQ
ncbi:DNA modification methylase [Candidatus Poribacteria bacterium]|nr:DNA modification methylase [Candidatus Poribacteria bacterium]MYH83113.1 DNA modification methylase [Candidatus Poribacteria bacterium]MYK96629.1 DNA modification methylase [Candidatus Poribacteria bacterium]